MEKNNQLSYLIIFLLFAVLAWGIYLFKAINSSKQASPTKAIVQTQEVPTLTLAEQFHKQLKSQLPKDYSTETVEYFETFSNPSVSATQIAPCKAISDPVDQPFCHTKLTLFESESAKSLQDSISKDPVLSTYSKRFQEKLVLSKLPNEVSLVFTPQPLMCLGTGGETCMRQRYKYHFQDGSNLVAEVSFWTFKNGQFQESPTKKVQELIEFYQGLLVK